MTVFAPSPVNPPRIPCTSIVGRAQVRSKTEKPGSPVSAGAFMAMSAAAALPVSAAAAEAMQAASTQHAAAAAECSAQERLVQQRRQEGQRVADAAAAARAAVLAAAELHSLSDIGVQRWSKAVEGIARELTACHRSQQAPVLAEARA